MPSRARSTQGTLLGPGRPGAGSIASRAPSRVDPPDDRADLTIADLDVLLGFVEATTPARRSTSITPVARCSSIGPVPPSRTRPPSRSRTTTRRRRRLGQESPSGSYQPPSASRRSRPSTAPALGGTYTLRIDNSSGANGPPARLEARHDTEHLRLRRRRRRPRRADNCPTVANADQTDWDGDRIGNACDSHARHRAGAADTTPTPTRRPVATGTPLHRRLRLRAHDRAAPPAERHRFAGTVESVAVGCRAGVEVTHLAQAVGRRPQARRGDHAGRPGRSARRRPAGPGRYYATVGSADAAPLRHRHAHASYGSATVTADDAPSHPPRPARPRRRLPLRRGAPAHRLRPAPPGPVRADLQRVRRADVAPDADRRSARHARRRPRSTRRPPPAWSRTST